MSIRVSRQAAARFLLASQGLLEADDLAPWRDELSGPDGTLEAVRRLECIQVDPVSLVSQNQHLVLWNRVRDYHPEQLDGLLGAGRVFEHEANARCVIPMEEYPLFRPRMRHYRALAWERRAELGEAPERILREITDLGPRTSREIESDERVVAYWDAVPRTKATSFAFELLWESGELMVTGRRGLEKVYDIPERVVPADLCVKAEETNDEEAARGLLDKYFRALRLFDVGDFRFGWQRMPTTERRALVDGAVRDGRLVEVEIEEVRRRYYVLSQDVDRLREFDRPGLDVSPRVFLVSPLDNLLWRRERLADVFGFEYTWEIYIPASKRRYGAYTMPIVRGDRIIGRVCPRADRKQGLLVVEGIWFEEGAANDQGVSDALLRLAEFAGLQEVSWIRTGGPPD